MTVVARWRVRCTTDNKDEYVWQNEDDGAPTVCPVDPVGHTIGPAPVTVERVGPNEVEIVPTVGAKPTRMDGILTEFDTGSDVKAEYTLPESLHMQSVKIKWWDALSGDYGWLAIVDPAGDTSPQSALSADDTTVTVGAGKGPAYAAGAYIEFWDATEASLVEQVEIDSVNGDVVTLKTGVQNAHGTDAKLRCCVSGYAPLRGANLKDGGFRMYKNGTEQFRSENEFTEAIAAGFILAVRFRPSAVAGARAVLLNYRFRKPNG